MMGTVYYLYNHTMKRFLRLGKRVDTGALWRFEQDPAVIAAFLTDCSEHRIEILPDSLAEMPHDDLEYREVIGPNEVENRDQLLLTILKALKQATASKKPVPPPPPPKKR